ncbi:unnamed protein product [Ilex paraguariensis]|uniref:Uncharacterized protein n=1 Tax=Ilex paraguariensis TaxID=185542 RepID=A0ABC8RG21_9AQUA
MSKFITTFRELATYKELLRSQVEHVLIDRLTQFLSIDVLDAKMQTLNSINNVNYCSSLPGKLHYVYSAKIEQYNWKLNKPLAYSALYHNSSFLGVAVHERWHVTFIGGDIVLSMAYRLCRIDFSADEVDCVQLVLAWYRRWLHLGMPLCQWCWSDRCGLIVALAVSLASLSGVV